VTFLLGATSGYTDVLRLYFGLGNLVFCFTQVLRTRTDNSRVEWWSLCRSRTERIGPKAKTGAVVHVCFVSPGA
jgi:hypothetical protein